MAGIWAPTILWSGSMYDFVGWVYLNAFYSWQHNCNIFWNNKLRQHYVVIDCHMAQSVALNYYKKWVGWFFFQMT